MRGRKSFNNVNAAKDCSLYGKSQSHNSQFKIEQFSDYINLHFSSSKSLIFTSQVSDLLTLVYPLADSASVVFYYVYVAKNLINLQAAVIFELKLRVSESETGLRRCLLLWVDVRHLPLFVVHQHFLLKNYSPDLNIQTPT